ncbi:DUF1488 domain-containing protein [Ferrimonas balearica]|uniref:DUF1488 domain-containing protein n=1 Tax=Ferrimonas balearica TaxID=44012 RepID=UPI001C99BA67|nr:DUF1488 domain-containing protein [Ferrimonas balearica]MBY5994184.1 DUF1488 domain-containing protein [Ferrimonas balearica]
MNQQILFNDHVEIQWEQGWAQFDAMVAGQRVPCLVGLNTLANKLDSTLTTAEEAAAAFEQLRFDLEAEAERLIEDDAFDAQGRIWLGHPPI